MSEFGPRGPSNCVGVFLLCMIFCKLCISSCISKAAMGWDECRPRHHRERLLAGSASFAGFAGSSGGSARAVAAAHTYTRTQTFIQIHPEALLGNAA
jgi:hypothetical protein